MKAISIKQPWAALIQSGRKTIEVRSWKTAYRGPLLICVSLQVDHDALARVGGPGHTSQMMNARGRALCIVDLIGCRPMAPVDEGVALVPCREGLFSWTLNNVRDTPAIPVKGRLGLFEVKIPDAKP